MKQQETITYKPLEAERDQCREDENDPEYFGHDQWQPEYSGLSVSVDVLCCSLDETNN